MTASPITAAGVSQTTFGLKSAKDPQASARAQAFNAQAFTIGNDKTFGMSTQNTESLEGRHLLAHELAHVIQQKASGVKIQCKSSSDR